MAVQRTFESTDSGTGMKRFMVRIVERGDGYGRWCPETQAFALVHDQDEPRVEFYDADIDFEPFQAQFVSRYYFSTLSREDRLSGIDLSGGNPQWQVAGEDFGLVSDFLKEYEASNGPIRKRYPLDFSHHLQ